MLPVSCKLDIFGGGIFLLHNYILASLLLLYDHSSIVTKIKCLHTVWLTDCYLSNVPNEMTAVLYTFRYTLVQSNVLFVLLFSCLGLNNNNNNNNNVMPDSTLCLVWADVSITDHGALLFIVLGTRLGPGIYDLLGAWILVHRSGMSVLVTVAAGFWTTWQWCDTMGIRFFLCLRDALRIGLVRGIAITWCVCVSVCL